MAEKSAEKVLKSPPFSSAVRNGDTVYVSGQGGLDLRTGKVVGDDLESQTVATMENIREVLARAGMTMNDIVKATIYLTDRDHYLAFNELYKRYFTQPYPARTVVYCDLNYELLVEIDVVAAAGGIKEAY